MKREVRISPTLAANAARFRIDLAAFADEALVDRVLQDVLHSATWSIKGDLLAAHQQAERFGHQSVTEEHLLLAMLLRPQSRIGELLGESGARDELVHRIEQFLNGATIGPPTDWRSREPSPPKRANRKSSEHVNVGDNVYVWPYSRHGVVVDKDEEASRLVTQMGDTTARVLDADITVIDSDK